MAGANKETMEQGVQNVLSAVTQVNPLMVRKDGWNISYEFEFILPSRGFRRAPQPVAAVHHRQRTEVDL